MKAKCFIVKSTGKKYPFCKDVANPPYRNVEKGIIKVVNDHPEFLEPVLDYYGKDVDNYDDAYRDEHEDDEGNNDE